MGIMAHGTVRGTAGTPQKGYKIPNRPGRPGLGESEMLNNKPTVIYLQTHISGHQLIRTGTKCEHSGNYDQREDKG